MIWYERCNWRNNYYQFVSHFIVQDFSWRNAISQHYLEESCSDIKVIGNSHSKALRIIHIESAFFILLHSVDANIPKGPSTSTLQASSTSSSKLHPPPFVLCSEGSDDNTNETPNVDSLLNIVANPPFIPLVLHMVDSIPYDRGKYV